MKNFKVLYNPFAGSAAKYSVYSCKDEVNPQTDKPLVSFPRAVDAENCAAALNNCLATHVDAYVGAEQAK